MTIVDNYIYGAYDFAGIWCDEINTLGRIENNTVHNTESGIHAIEFDAAATGNCKNNMLYTDSYGIGLDPGSMACFGNLHSYGADTAPIDTPLLPGKQYTLMAADASVTIASQPQFIIAGGPIKIVDFFGLVTGQVGAATLMIQSVGTIGPTTFPYTTLVDCTGDIVGTTYTFTGAVPSVLTPLVGAHNRSGTNNQWYAPVGTVDMKGDADVAGIVEWYMTFIPLATGVVVTDGT